MSTIKTNQLAHTANGASVYTLPTTDGQAGQVLQTNGSGVLSWVSLPTSGVTMVDQWRLTAHMTLSTSATVISSYWERNDSTGYGGIGTGMTESSGIFTFPTTGIYLVTFMGTAHGNGGATLAITARISTQKGGGSFADRGQIQESAYTSNAYGSMFGQILFDVEDTAGDKVRITALAANSGRYLLGDTNMQRTGLTFTRLGDT